MLAKDRKPKAPRRARGRPKVEDVAQIENALLKIALTEFLAHGYGATSINRIIKAAGVSKTTLYSRFASKAQLFRAIMDAQIQQYSMHDVLNGHRRRAGLEQGLFAYANRSLETSLEGDFLNINRLIYSESQRFPELGMALAERTQLGVRQLSAFIRECAEADQIPCRDPDLVASTLVLANRGWYVNVMISNQTVSVKDREEWVRSLVHIILADRANW